MEASTMILIFRILILLNFITLSILYFVINLYLISSKTKHNQNVQIDNKINRSAME